MWKPSIFFSIYIMSINIFFLAIIFYPLCNAWHMLSMCTLYSVIILLEYLKCDVIKITSQFYYKYSINIIIESKVHMLSVWQAGNSFLKIVFLKQSYSRLQLGSDLKKIPISQGLVTLLHICGVTPILQLPILSYLTVSVWVFYKCFIGVLLMVHNVLPVFNDFLQCFTMSNNALRCLVSHTMTGISDRQSPRGSAMTAMTPQRLAIMTQGSAITLQKWSHAKLRSNCVPGRQFSKGVRM